MTNADDAITVASKSRLHFFDSLRMLMVLFVVVFHAAMPYVVDFGAFWPYKDANPSLVLDILVAFIDVFNMAILFYISGYFALPSIRKGAKRFAKSKIISLGIP